MPAARKQRTPSMGSNAQQFGQRIGFTDQRIGSGLGAAWRRYFDCWRRTDPRSSPKVGHVGVAARRLRRGTGVRETGRMGWRVWSRRPGHANLLIRTKELPYDLNEIRGIRGCKMSGSICRCRYGKAVAPDLCRKTIDVPLRCENDLCARARFEVVARAPAISRSRPLSFASQSAS